MGAKLGAGDGDEVGHNRRGDGEVGLLCRLHWARCGLVDQRVWHAQEVEALLGAVLDALAALFIDACEEVVELTDQRGVGELVSSEALDAVGRDGALPGGRSAVAERSAEVTCVVDELPVGRLAGSPPGGE